MLSNRSAKANPIPSVPSVTSARFPYTSIHPAVTEWVRQLETGKNDKTFFLKNNNRCNESGTGRYSRVLVDAFRPRKTRVEYLPTRNIARDRYRWPYSAHWQYNVRQVPMTKSRVLLRWRNIIKSISLIPRTNEYAESHEKTAIKKIFFSIIWHFNDKFRQQKVH